MSIIPPGVTPGNVEHRFATGQPASYDAGTRTVEAAISLGSDVQRTYGTERLRISPSAIDTSRVDEGGVPVLNSHNPADIKNILGRIVATWIKNGVLMGKIAFAETPEGKRAEAMVSRGELRSVSAGYSVQRWSVADADGNAVDIDDIGYGNSELTFTAERWTLIEVSLVATPADQKATIRSLGDPAPQFVRDARARMACRMRMRIRHSMVLRGS